ncbi:RNA polymerase sigma factor SigF, partial [Actinoplanes sp. NPDC004185]
MTAATIPSTTLSDAPPAAGTSATGPAEPLGGETAAELLIRLAATPSGDRRRARLRDRAIEAWLPLARHLAHRYSGRGEPTDDLVQTA